MTEMKDVTIIIPTRANLDFLIAAVKSIRDKKQYDNCKILIGADTPTDEVSNWLTTYKEEFNFTWELFTKKKQSRVGIVSMVEKLIELVDTEFVFYMHDDMIIGDFTIDNLIKSSKEKRILSSKRVEPPLYKATVEKDIKEFGLTPDEFKNDEFLAWEKTAVEDNKAKGVPGFFAPHFFKKTDWVGYDHDFEPQSREDSDLAQRFVDAGFELLTVWDSLVYHFSGKGSRKKTGGNDSDEWQLTNYKNERNYIRKWKTLAHTPFIMPVRTPDIPISAHVLVGKEESRMMQFLDNVEPFFDEIVFMFDKQNQDKSIDVIQAYVDKQKKMQPNNFDDKKFKLFTRDLNNDFAAQTNMAIEECSHEWTMKIDVDEQFPIDFLSKLRFVIQEAQDKNPNIEVIGFPRINTLDGKLSNDIPREHWYTKEFHKYPAQTEHVRNKDVQFRLHKKNVRWVNPVHELPKCVKDMDRDRFIIANDYFLHPKDRKRQQAQDEKYKNIIAPKKATSVLKYVYDSVIYTVEGITQHAREEIKELVNRDKDVLLLDNRYQSGFGEVFKDLYKPVDFINDNYVTIVNQPPSRWANNQHFKNRIGFMAFEGALPKYWVDMINKSNIKELWTPSSYCMEMFKKSGVNKPLMVLPHGIDPEVWKPTEVVSKELKEIKGNDFVFLAAGTYQNNRKGFDLLAKAFSEEFSPEEKVKLLFKINKIYSPEDSFNKYINKYLTADGNRNVEYIDENLPENDLVQLFNMADTYVSPHRAEGFGLNMLNALAVGTPLIATKATGNMDFCNEDNTLFVDVEDKERWAVFIPPYDDAKWPEPTVSSLRKQLRKAFKDKSLKKKALDQSSEIREQWSWKNTVDIMEARTKHLFS